MPGTDVTALAKDEPVGDLTWIPTTYRRPITRFVEAGAFAWARGVADAPGEYDWVASLELCSLVTGQASRLRRRRGLKQAVITWENLPNQPLYKIPPYRQALQSCRDADLLLCMVDAAREHLLDNGFDEAQIEVVKPGIDTELFKPAARWPDQPTITFISPLAPNKGIDTVLEAVQIVQRTIPEVQLKVAGSGPLSHLVDAAAADPARRVQHVGALDAAGVADLLQGTSLFTTAPRPTWKWTEQLGLAYLEAQACGLPVVTTRCGTNDEAVAAPPNDLVDGGAEELAERFAWWLEHPTEAAAVGATNRSRMVAEHDLHTQCVRMAAAFAARESG